MDDAQKAKEMARIDRQLREKSVSVDDYLSEDEWKQYLDSGNAGRHNDIPDDVYRPVYNATVRKTQRTQMLYKGLGLILLLCICGGAFFFLYHPKQPVTAKVFDHTNTSTVPQRIQLPDGTVVILQPTSEIMYGSDYNNTSRDITLIGNGEFRVAKDDTRPLTVYCRDIAVTALGTRFSLSGLPADVLVQLHEGKVRVRDTANVVPAIYPAPGEIFAYMAESKQFVAVDINGLPLRPDKTPIGANYIKPKRVTAPETNKAYLNFENATLSDVFGYLAMRYQVQIRYETDQAMFSNTFVSVDADLPVDKILENICRANRMKLKAHGDSLYIISK
ncbi:FecR family protein [Chitinophaga horti]|uniref:FecR family protein n=1 Tax=Chitinophaga horti TaxID=2920382 RepID=A0ABY6IX15_9BACT|nr:FecR family protein [Chitinophaga horti]UYQ91925.1 FecR family protein [Chitinophaga horti]